MGDDPAGAGSVSVRKLVTASSTPTGSGASRRTKNHAAATPSVSAAATTHTTRAARDIRASVPRLPRLRKRLACETERHGPAATRVEPRFPPRAPLLKEPCTQH